MSNTDILYKLIILYILGKVDFPMTGYQLGEYLIDKEYTDYFTFQQDLIDLRNSNYIEEKFENGKKFYLITQDGLDSLKMFKDSKISPAIQREVDVFLSERGYEFRSDNLITCSYYKNRMGEYDVHCQIKDGHTVLLDMTICVPTENQARATKENWRRNKEEIYKDIMKKLL